MIILKIPYWDIQELLKEHLKKKLKIDINELYTEVTIENTPITWQKKGKKIKETRHKKQEMTFVPNRDDTWFEILIEL